MQQIRRSKFVGLFLKWMHGLISLFWVINLTMVKVECFYAIKIRDNNFSKCWVLLEVTNWFTKGDYKNYCKATIVKYSPSKLERIVIQSIIFWWSNSFNNATKIPLLISINNSIVFGSVYVTFNLFSLRSLNIYFNFRFKILLSNKPIAFSNPEQM